MVLYLFHSLKSQYACKELTFLTGFLIRDFCDSYPLRKIPLFMEHAGLRNGMCLYPVNAPENAFIGGVRTTVGRAVLCRKTGRYTDLTDEY